MCGCSCHVSYTVCPIPGGCCSGVTGPVMPPVAVRTKRNPGRDLACEQCNCLVDPNVAMLSESRFGTWLCTHCYHLAIARTADTPPADWPARADAELLIFEDEAAERLVASCTKCGQEILTVSDARRQYGCRKAIAERWKNHLDKQHPPIGEVIKENGETGLIMVGQHPYSQVVDNPTDLTYKPCTICGLSREDDVHEKDNQYMRDRIGADLVECLECKAMVDALETTRVMKDHSGRMVHGRMCKVCLTPPAKRNPFVVLAVKLQRGQITEDEYEAELEKLNR